MTKLRISMSDELDGLSMENAEEWEDPAETIDYLSLAELAATEWADWRAAMGIVVYVRMWDMADEVVWDGRVEFQLCPKAVETPCQS